MNKLPTIDGQERELRDGDRVRLRCGIDDTVKHDAEHERIGGEWMWDGLAGYAYARDGHYSPHGLENDLDIVLILGPESQDNGDGTVTKVKTVEVRGQDELVDRLRRVILYDCNNSEWTTEIGAATSLYTKPAPSPTYTEKLIEAVRQDTLQLPFHAVRLEFRKGRPIWISEDGELIAHDVLSFGMLPKHVTESDADPIDLATVRAAAEVGK